MGYLTTAATYLGYVVGSLILGFFVFLCWEYLRGVWCSRGIRKYNAEDAFYREHAIRLMAYDLQKASNSSTDPNELTEIYMEKSRREEGGVINPTAYYA
jgi:hypothetical protein